MPVFLGQELVYRRVSQADPEFLFEFYTRKLQPDRATPLLLLCMLDRISDLVLAVSQ
jgi:hypothetical protein